MGDEFTNEEYTVDAPQIREFAQQFDPQPFHLDEDAARKSSFEGLAASGWHTAAITMRLLVGSVPLAGGLIGAGSEITWPRPDKAGRRASCGEHSRGFFAYPREKVQSRITVPKRPGVSTRFSDSSA